ncbi:alanine--glyoxylate aminotransferase family protein [Streptomyces xinghaiensis]|uniref:Alanine--glyoxylate aminotransferase family protein n=2 Tax=Streptomyces xinghaiensis TaxID=1038928 RepID=A0A3R7IUX4_9ACTN|nr:MULTISPECIES: alanine--glyoxylate aminotransferase family protein [Streptomyces]PQM22362.1 aminotransferase class V-fold PLP-dependent enzyme [Streptomyces xinghaiensis]RKM96671.1 alanine--glyoxylate aminotransferase family protein [Streptomyces xinghaiensis]RNC74177.1 alanine--glyoxylate aminotransferase family protein [Streptomyces xinghaiensis]
MHDVAMFTPGPTHIPLAMRMASISRLTHHRSPEFTKLHDRIHSGLQSLFATGGRILMLPASGTGAMEAVVANVVEPDDTVLVLAAGKYGRRWAELCRTYRADVRLHEVPDGATFDAAAVERALRDARPRHLFLTHCETSTGAVHDVRTLAALGREYGATVVADTMTSIAVEPFHMDDWGVDFAVTASHKGLMSPPGAAFVAVGDQAWERVRPAQGYSYWNFHILRASALESTVPNTPPTTALFAVGAALDAIEAEGLTQVWERHARSAAVCRAGIGALGLELFPRSAPSNALTAVRLPERVRTDGLVEELHHRFGFRVAGGQGGLKGRIVRVGHIGAVTPLQLMPVLTALEMLLLERGLDRRPGTASAAMAGELWDGLAPGRAV